LVPFRETLAPHPAINNEESEFPTGTIIKSAADSEISIKVRVIPLPTCVRDFLMKNKVPNPLEPEAKLFYAELQKKFVEALEEEKYNNLGVAWNEIVDRIVAFGAKSAVSNILVNKTEFPSGW
jgi:hypothetical protein